MEKTPQPVTDQTALKIRTEQKSGWVDFIVKNWFTLLLVASAIITVISVIIKSLIPEVTIIKDNSWNEITPGFSSYEQLIEKMGPPIETIETEDGFNLKYQSDFLAIPNQVVTSKEGTVQFVREFLKYDPNHLLEQYTKKYGQPDLVLSDPQSGPAVKANVFLEQGVLIMAHVKDGSVEQKWYFSPTTSEIFLQSWGETLSKEDTKPERAF